MQFSHVLGAIRLSFPVTFDFSGRQRSAVVHVWQDLDWMRVSARKLQEALVGIAVISAKLR